LQKSLEATFNGQGQGGTLTPLIITFADYYCRVNYGHVKFCSQFGHRKH